MIKVLHDLILLEPPIAPAALGSGLIVLSVDEATLKCRVAGVGPGTVLNCGKEVFPSVKEGDIVHVPKEVVNNAPSTVHKGITYRFVKQAQILCWETPE